MALIWRGGCKDGPCPNLYDIDTRPPDVAVQGALVTDPTLLAGIQVPDHEAVVIIPRELLIEYAKAYLEERAPA